MANPSRVLSAVRSVSSFGEGVYEVVFGVPARYTRFLPGQFLHLTLDEFDPTTGYWPESRVFSIASEPRLDHVTVVYSVKGAYTQRMEKELAVGRPVWLKFPYGDFIIGEDLLDSGPLALIAGGTGVSPYWPFLKNERVRYGDVHLFYGIRRPEHLLFRPALEQLKTADWFHLHLSVEEGAIPDLGSRTGRLSIENIAQELGDGFAKTNFFLSGPPVMINRFKTDLGTRGIAPEQIHVDEWE